MVSRRALEVATALLTGAFGATVAVSSLDNGIGWSQAGVESGTFPFIIGLIILVASAYNMAHGWRGASGTAITRADLHRSAALFLPAALYVAVIPLLGIYIASLAYLFGTLRVQRRLGTVRSLAIAFATALFLYVVFERAFQVSLPHGAFGAVLGW
jgi:hypothetical protein